MIKTQNICNKCRKGTPEFAGYWVSQTTQQPYYVYQCGFCKAMQREPVPHTWDKDHPGAAGYFRGDFRVGARA